MSCCITPQKCNTEVTSRTIYHPAKKKKWGSLSYAAEFLATRHHCRTKAPEEEAPPTYSPSLIWAGESYIMAGNYYLLISNKINVVSACTRLSGSAVAGVLYEPSSQVTPLSGVELPYRPASLHRLEPCPSYVAWRAVMATPLSWLSWVVSSKTPASDDASASHHPRTSFLVKVVVKSFLNNRPMKFFWIKS